MNNTLFVFEIDANYENVGTITTEKVRVLSETETALKLCSEDTVVEVNKNRFIESIEDLSKIQYGGFAHEYLWYVPFSAGSDELVQSVIAALLEKQLNVLRIQKISAESFLEDMGSDISEKAIESFVKNESVSDMLSSHEAELVILQVRHNKIFFDQYEGVLRKSTAGEYIFTSTSYKEDFDHHFNEKDLSIGKKIVKPHTVPLREILLLPTDSNEVMVNKITAARKEMLQDSELDLELLNRKAKVVQTALSKIPTQSL